MQKFLEKLYNPAMGIVPLLLFAVLQGFTPYDTSLLIGVITYVVFALATIPTLKFAPPNMLITSGVVFCMYIFMMKFTPIGDIDHLYTSIVLGVIFLIIIGFVSLLKPYIKAAAIKKDKSRGNGIRITRLNEYFHVLRLYKNVLICHLLTALSYQILPDEYKSPELDKFMYYILNMILIVLIIVYETIRLRLLKKKMESEEWLPVVNETGKVIGKVAFSISKKSKKFFLHPVVRVALIYKGFLYLTERPGNFILDPLKIDYPFEEYIKFQDSIDDTVKDVLVKKTGVSNLPAKFVFRYLFRNNITNRLVYLFTINIQSEEVMNSLTLEGGKLWTEKQIEENLGTGVFSDCFEKEYDILKNTVLMASKMVNNPEKIKD